MRSTARQGNVTGVPVEESVADPARVVVFGPHPLLSIVIEARPGATDDIHLHAGGQGVWVANMAAALGAHPILCGLLGGEVGAVLAPLLAAMPGERRLVRTATESGSFVMDRRSGPCEPVAQAVSSPPTRHELDDLVAATVAASLQAGVLVLCNPYPGDAIGAEVFARLATDVGAHGVRVLADLSSPRLEAALSGGLDLVKINDWELAEFVSGPVGEPRELAAAARQVIERGAEMVVITRGERPAVVFRGARTWELEAPRFESGFREGCGDSMMGAIAAVTALGEDWPQALRIGAAAGAVNFLRRGLGTGDAAVITELARSVTLRPLPTAGQPRVLRRAR
jgi:1-phosphofructokinase